MGCKEGRRIWACQAGGQARPSGCAGDGRKEDCKDESAPAPGTESPPGTPAPAGAAWPSAQQRTCAASVKSICRGSTGHCGPDGCAGGGGAGAGTGGVRRGLRQPPRSHGATCSGDDLAAAAVDGVGVQHHIAHLEERGGGGRGASGREAGRRTTPSALRVVPPPCATRPRPQPPPPGARTSNTMPRMFSSASTPSLVAHWKAATQLSLISFRYCTPLVMSVSMLGPGSGSGGGGGV